MIDRINADDFAPPSRDWHALATRVLDGHRASSDEALSILRSDDDELLDVLAASFRIRRRYFGKRVQLYFLMNAKSGLCPEDCGYCSQSKVSEAEIPRYNILNAEKLLAGAKVAAERNAKTYCIVDLGSRPLEARNGSRHKNRAADQGAVQLEDLRLLGPLECRASRAAQGLRRRSSESQFEHQRSPLPRYLHHAHLSRIG